MSAQLSAVPVSKRRQLAVALGLFAALFAAVGGVGLTGTTSGVVVAFVVVAFVAALLLGLVAWGLAASIRADAGERDLDAAVTAALAASGARTCGCGHEHDPEELHVVDDPCAQDGHGVECTHSCDTCVLARLRPSQSERIG